MELKINIFKLLTAMFILLNVVVLVSGYVIMHDVFKAKNNLELEQDYYLKKEEDLIARIDILKQSNVDLYANIKSVNDDTQSLKNDVLQYAQNTQSTQDQQLFFQNELSNALNKNAVLKQNVATVQNKIQQQAAAPVVRKTVVKRKTRSS